MKTTTKCDEVWGGPYKVTAILSVTGVELEHDVVTRHISHIRKAKTSQIKKYDSGSDDSDGELQENNSEVSQLTTTNASDLGDLVSESKNEHPQQENNSEFRQSKRARRPPKFLADYELYSSGDDGGV